MKPPRVRSRPASSARISTAVGRRCGRDATGSRPGSAWARGSMRDRRRDRRSTATGGGSGSNGRSGTRSARRQRRRPASPSSRTPKSAGSGSQIGIDQSGSTGSSTSGRGRFVVGGVARRASGKLTRPRPVALIARGERLRLVEAEADDAADRVVADGHAVQRVGGLDRAPVVGDDDELGLVRRGCAAPRRSGRCWPRRARRRPRRGRRTGRAGPRASRTAGRPRSAPARRRTASPAPGPSCPAVGRRSRCRSSRGPTGRSSTAWRSRRRRAARSASRTPSRAPRRSSGTGRRSSCRARRSGRACG